MEREVITYAIKEIFFGLALILAFNIGPTLAAEPQAISLHCSGWYRNATSGAYEPVLENYRIASDGSWVAQARFKAQGDNESPKVWYYKLEHLGYTQKITFYPTDLRMLVQAVVYGQNGKLYVYTCIPYDNPFTQ